MSEYFQFLQLRKNQYITWASFRKGLVSTGIVSLAKIICRRNFGNEFAFTQQRLLVLLSSLTFVTDETSPQISMTHEHIFLRQTYFVKEKMSVETRPNVSFRIFFFRSSICQHICDGKFDQSNRRYLLQCFLYHHTEDLPRIYLSHLLWA